jgi:hypothetical protein
MDGVAFCVRAAVRFMRHDLMERKRGGAVFLECVVAMVCVSPRTPPVNGMNDEVGLSVAAPGPSPFLTSLRRCSCLNSPARARVSVAFHPSRLVSQLG